MPKLIDAVRVTTRNDTVWRYCAGCGLLAALPPDIEHCDTCQPADPQPAPRGGVR